ELTAFQPDGPYFLGGYSFGGLVAYEMAQQLSARGQQVAFLGLIDAYFSNVPRAPKSLRFDLALVVRRMGFHLDNITELGVLGAPWYVLERIARRIAPSTFKP